MVKNNSSKELSKKFILIESDVVNTRVAVVDSKSHKLLEYDIEMSSCKSLRGNIYLAQVSRVEPALQSAFVNYGSNKHGFLPFNEIHPNYYQLPVEDKEFLYEEQRKELEARTNKLEKTDEIHGNCIVHVLIDENPKRKSTAAYDRFNKYLHGKTLNECISNGVMKRDIKLDLQKNYIALFKVAEPTDSDLDQIDSSFIFRQKYRINEVISPGQVMLVQVVRDTKGTKGVPLTTYLSLAGQYCVFMPNSNRNICISHKVVDQNERKKIKDLLKEIHLPDGMGFIVRTAGANKSLSDIKNDLKNQMNLWEKIRSVTIKSTAPVLIHEDSHPLNRAIRDIYDDDVEGIYIDGNVEANKKIGELIDYFIPHFKNNINYYKDKVGLFSKYNIQSQIANIYQSHVPLPSGGHIVIHPTEALVAIDVNSGKAVKEYNIEETALKTNLEAALEIAAQIRLRNLSGIVVIDFIDMRNNQNNIKVEKRIIECLKPDSAKTQVGRINNFGLLSMSRQRTYIGSQEIGSEICVCCNGSGAVLSNALASTLTLNSLEEFMSLNSGIKVINIKIMPKIAEYIINNYRDKLSCFEQANNVSINVIFDNSLIYPNFYEIVNASNVNKDIDEKKNISTHDDKKLNKRNFKNNKSYSHKKIDKTDAENLHDNNVSEEISKSNVDNNHDSESSLVISKKQKQRKFFRRKDKSASKNVNVADVDNV